MSLKEQQVAALLTRVKNLEGENEQIKQSYRNLAAFIDKRLVLQITLNTMLGEWILNNATPDKQEQFIAFAAERGFDIRDNEDAGILKQQSKIIVPGR